MLGLLSMYIEVWGALVKKVKLVSLSTCYKLLPPIMNKYKHISKSLLATFTFVLIQSILILIEFN